MGAILSKVIPNGYGTYIALFFGAALLIIEGGAGIDIPGVDVGPDWLNQLYELVVVGFLRRGVGGALKGPI